jgi:hypothetical protein
MKWEKRGLIYAPAGDAWWARSYAHLPTVDVLDDETIRVYFASLDERQFGRIGYVDLDSSEPKRILHIATTPVLDIGEPGTFDDSGVNPSCVVSLDGKKYMYYIGWQRCERVPYMLFAGLAIAEDGKTYRKISRVPILDRTAREPFLRSATAIVVDGEILKCWYVSGQKWTRVGEKLYPSYVVRYAESRDGIRWASNDHVSIGFRNEDELGFGRPWVIKEDGIYKMWYSIRSRRLAYRLGYAESEDGVGWVRKDDEVGIECSDAGWDSEMICYPCVIDIAGARYMFYNGNRHGATGFGYAVLK